MTKHNRCIYIKTDGRWQRATWDMLFQCMGKQCGDAELGKELYPAHPDFSRVNQNLLLSLAMHNVPFKVGKVPNE